MEKEGQKTGELLNKIESYKRILSEGGIDPRGYSQIKQAYNGMVDKYANHPVVKNRGFQKWQF